ncbi:hypothetical protein OZ12_07385 [Xanthomonas translucens pv. translucens]|nr:hypothetical protein OZ12_07385 [Xanthomonas translucens pv. translucens]CCP40773.1 HTH-type transcriptional regulator benM [Xanthomonas translucens pv. translucens DSM 18974]SCB04127.1 unnamed protein product [Xanthomonas translucens pv. translucens DSM 18974]
MARETLNDLLAFVTVAREASFTRAAAQLGLSQSTLSHSVRGLETRPNNCIACLHSVAGP